MKKSFRIPLLFCLLVILSACAIPTALTATTPVALPTVAPTSAPLATRPLPSPTASPITETPFPAISREVLSNFSYWLTDFNTTAAFQDGVLIEQVDTQPGELHLRGRMIDPIASGDLNGDSLADAVVILAVNSGGSGTFFYLVVLLNNHGAPVQTASTWIGDRQAVKNLQIKDGQIVLDFLTQGPNDGLCCPSQHHLRSYQLQNNTLQIVSDQVVN